jgi:hypothetical protein
VAFFILCFPYHLSLAQSEITFLRPGIAVEREISGGERFSYGLKLAADQFASVSVEHQGFISTKVFGPDERLLSSDEGD